MNARDELVLGALLNRRTFLGLAVSTAGAAMACAVNPVTGESQFMLMSEQQEIAIDREHSPHQISSDLGPVQDSSLNAYLTGVGSRLSGLSHRPRMPYTYRAVNATYVNAYAFPGGTIAVTRGILLELDNEAELAALLGHEIGHVNARHTASRMTTGAVTGLLVGGLAAAAGGSEGAGGLVSGLGGLGAGLLLASYSRDDERQADALGMEYMVRAGHSPEGMVGLMDVLRSKSRREPSALETMFSTHPMSDERYRTALKEVRGRYAGKRSLPLSRERYKDRTAGLRAMGEAILAMQDGDREMGAKKYDQARDHYAKALRLAPEDYAANVKMATCHLARKDYARARSLARAAGEVYPGEAHAMRIAGLAALLAKDYDAAQARFRDCERALPGNPDIVFFRGLSLEGAGNRPQAARQYARYLKSVRQGGKAKHAYGRLVEWGYVKPS